MTPGINESRLKLLRLFYPDMSDEEIEIQLSLGTVDNGVLTPSGSYGKKS